MGQSLQVLWTGEYETIAARRQVKHGTRNAVRQVGHETNATDRQEEDGTNTAGK
jgi:hypothetical protein